MLLMVFPKLEKVFPKLEKMCPKLEKMRPKFQFFLVRPDLQAQKRPKKKPDKVLLSYTLTFEL